MVGFHFLVQFFELSLLHGRLPAKALSILMKILANRQAFTCLVNFPAAGCWVGLTHVSLPYDIAAAHADRQACQSYQNLTHYTLLPNFPQTLE